MMAQRNIARISPDELWREWQTDIERITRDAYELFSIRRQFREIATMFEQNTELQKAGSNLWSWIQTLYASAVLMRVRREVDTQGNTVNLRTLLEEIEKRSDVVTRKRVAARNSSIGELLAKAIDDGFTKQWVGASATGLPDDRIDRDVVRADRLALEKATAELDEITSRTIAHRTRNEPAASSVAGVGSIFDLIEHLLKKYLALLTGSALVNVEPTPQFDTEAPFMFPWHPSAYAKWKRREKE